MIPQQSEDQLLGNAREPPRLEGVIHMTGQMMGGSIKDVAVRAPDGSVGQIDSVRNDQLGQQGIAPGFENMQAPMVANENANPVAANDIGRDESRRDYGPVGQREAEANRDESQKVEELKAQKPKDKANYEDEYEYEDKDEDALKPEEVSVHRKYRKIATISHTILT